MMTIFLTIFISGAVLFYFCTSDTSAAKKFNAFMTKNAHRASRLITFLNTGIRELLRKKWSTIKAKNKFRLLSAVGLLLVFAPLFTIIYFVNLHSPGTSAEPPPFVGYMLAMVICLVITIGGLLLIMCAFEKKKSR